MKVDRRLSRLTELVYPFKPLPALLGCLVLAGLASAQAPTFRPADRWTSAPMAVGPNAELSMCNLNRDGMPDAVVMDGHRLSIVLNPRAWLEALPVATHQPVFDSVMVLPEGGHDADALLTAQGLTVSWWEMKQDIIGQGVGEAFQTDVFLDGAALGWTEITDWRCMRFNLGALKYTMLAIHDAPQQLIHRYMLYGIEAAGDQMPFGTIPLGPAPAPTGTSHVEFYRFTEGAVPETIVASDTGLRVFGNSLFPLYELLADGPTIALERIPGASPATDLLAWHQQTATTAEASIRVFLGSQLTDEFPVSLEATTLRSGDLDGDGDSDLLVGPNADDRLVAFMDIADDQGVGGEVPVGEFSDGVEIEYAQFTGGIIPPEAQFSFPPKGLVASDLDCDGNVDLVTLSRLQKAMEAHYGHSDDPGFVFLGDPDSPPPPAGADTPETSLVFWLYLDEELEALATDLRITIYDWNYTWDQTPGSLELQGLEYAEDLGPPQQVVIDSILAYPCADGRMLYPMYTGLTYPEGENQPPLYGIEVSAYHFDGDRPSLDVITTFAYTRDVALWEELDPMIPQSLRLHPDEVGELPEQADPPVYILGQGGTLAGGMISLAGFDDFTEEEYMRVPPPTPIH